MIYQYIVIVDNILIYRIFFAIESVPLVSVGSVPLQSSDFV